MYYRQVDASLSKCLEGTCVFLTSQYTVLFEELYRKALDRSTPEPPAVDKKATSVVETLPTEHSCGQSQQCPKNIPVLTHGTNRNHALEIKSISGTIIYSEQNALSLIQFICIN